MVVKFKSQLYTYIICIVYKSLSIALSGWIVRSGHVEFLSLRGLAAYNSSYRRVLGPTPAQRKSRGTETNT